MTERLCILCGRPLPPPRWWEWAWLLPPFHDQSRDPDCARIMRERVGL